MLNKAISVEELNGYIHSIFLAEEMLIGISIFGEVSGFKISGAHAYFTLKGENAAINCNCFNYSRTYKPKDGEKVLLKGSPDYYAKTGRLSFNVMTIQPIGVGDLHAKFEALKASLEKEGIFAESHKKAIPEFCQDVCVITSKTGAVIRDIVRTVRLVNNAINIHVYNVRVQGEGAENEISDAILAVDGKYDVIIVARGGGSFEDLAPFNTEIVARTVYSAMTPIISAVGHETDFSLCDFASDARAATPTAAANCIAYNQRSYIDTILDKTVNMTNSIQSIYNLTKKDFEHSAAKLTAEMKSLVANARLKLNNSISELKSNSNTWMNDCEKALQKTISNFSAANPCGILQKGYFGVVANGKRKAKVSDFIIGEKITLIGVDGSCKATVEEVENEF